MTRTVVPPRKISLVHPVESGQRNVNDKIRPEQPLQDEAIAMLPYPPQDPTMVSILRQYLLCINVVLAEYRQSWFIQAFIGFLVPMGFAFFLLSIGNVTTTERAIFLLGGNLATSITFGPTSFLILKLGMAKQWREFDYWVALPLPKFIVVLAIVTVALLFALPGLAAIYIFGSLLFGLPFTNVLYLLPLIPLATLPLAGLGAFLGSFAPNGQVATNITNALIVYVGFLSPMMIPASSLPVPLRILSYFVPTTYVADAFRVIIGSSIDMKRMTFDMLILLLFSVVFLTLAYLRLNWRSS